MSESRDAEGILIQQGGRRYADPGEALKVWWAGKLRLGCTESLYANYATHPCGKPPKHDPDARGFPTKCGIHSSAAKERRKRASDDRYLKFKRDLKRKQPVRVAEANIESALRKIADGYNDARGLAQEVIAALDEARKPL